MPSIQIVFFCSVSLLLMFIILSVMRKRMLRENYSLLWIFISLMLLVIVALYPLLVVVSNFFVATPTSMMMFGGMVALLLLIFQLSVMNSSQAMEIKNLAQKVALIDFEMRMKRK